ncbi:hypothetical protein C8R46DRAFT_1066434 [Mycena filopes]|nr:hypothetical protein C8R46DRAFT_1066434 [Mycena filopes]
MAPPHIPPEVVDTIIDHLASHPHTLRSCTVTSRAWLPRSRHHLFRRLSISTSQLHRFLAHCKHFGPAVVSLVFRASRNHRRHRVVTTLLSEWARRGSFQSYTALTSLQVNGLHFLEFSHLLQLIAAFPRLENLYILDVTWISAAKSTSVRYSTGAFSRLSHLSLSARSLDPIFAWLDGHELPVLDSVSLTISDGNSTERILAFLSKLALQHVQIGPAAICTPLAQRICHAHALFLFSEVVLSDPKASFLDLRRPFTKTGIPPFVPLRQFQNPYHATFVVCDIPPYSRLGPGWASTQAAWHLAEFDKLLSCQRLAHIPRFVMALGTGYFYTAEQMSRHMPVSARRGALAFWNQQM